MFERSTRAIVTRLLAKADIGVDGSRPWDLQIANERFFRRALRGSVGFGESYMDGDWDVASLDAMFRRLVRADLGSSLMARCARLWLDLRSRLTNMQSRRRAKTVAESHYDLDHRLFELFLGPLNQYTCCFFRDTEDLAEAEIQKLEMICDKLELGPDDRVLDIGCGWGGFARYAAETRGCRVTGISISSEQCEYARRFTAGLPVEIVQVDYRQLPERFAPGAFDKVLICGMIEHVGYKNYRRIFEIVHHMLAPEGLFLLHTIGNRDTTTIGDPWMEKYIFRNSMMPSMAQLVRALEGLYTVHDWENYGHYYADTLSAWERNFEANWPRIQALETRQPFDERFRRMFRYYFNSCKASFQVESILLWQIVMSRQGARRQVYWRVNLGRPVPA